MQTGRSRPILGIRRIIIVVPRRFIGHRSIFLRFSDGRGKFAVPVCGLPAKTPKVVRRWRSRSNLKSRRRTTNATSCAIRHERRVLPATQIELELIASDYQLIIPFHTAKNRLCGRFRTSVLCKYQRARRASGSISDPASSRKLRPRVSGPRATEIAVITESVTTYSETR